MRSRKARLIEIDPKYDQVIIGAHKIMLIDAGNTRRAHPYVGGVVGKGVQSTTSPALWKASRW
jgi:hypothetical protein